MQELAFNAGDDVFIESFSPENRYGVVFEDDGETGYFYAVEKDGDGHGVRILDALHIYEAHEGPDEERGGAASGGEDAGGEEAGDPGEGGDDDEGDENAESEEGVEAGDGEEGGDGFEAGEEGETGEAAEGAGGRSNMQIVWSKDWLKCALVIDGYCQAIFDFEAQGGYSINEFPEPNAVWTKGERTLTEELINRLF